MARAPNREALRLYRDILRTARNFHWFNEHGEQWSKVLARSARAEFEEARHEKDPIIIARLLVVGQDCVMQASNKAFEAESAIRSHVVSSRNREA